MKAFFTWYADTTQTTNPTVKIKQLRNERKAQEYLEDHEIDKLLKIFDRSCFPEHRDFMVIMLILDTGMRLGECLQVTVDDLDMDDRTICLPAENTKGRRTRYVFFPVKTAKSLQRWLRYKDRYTSGKLLFPKKLVCLWISIHLNPGSSGIWDEPGSTRPTPLMPFGITSPSAV